MSLDIDKRNIWHPYTSMVNPLTTYLIKKANRVHILLENGNSLIDGMSSWWAVIHGYNHPKLNEALKIQIDNFSHVMFGGLTHEPAIELTKRLLTILPESLDKFFYSDSGSVAVEVSMKMALQYFNAIGNKEKKEFITFRSGYFGDTWNAMSVCDPYTGMHKIFNGKLPIQNFINKPVINYNDEWDNSQISEIEKILSKKHSKIAGFILEPIVQGAGGMNFYHPNYLKIIRDLCNKYDILLIFDEIATGFGRTGKIFALEHANVTPDILNIGKAITGGYITFAATVTTKNIAETISNGENKVFMHGPTFMGNALACSVACASFDLLMSYNLKEMIRNIENIIKYHFNYAKEYKNVNDVRVLGAIGVIEMKKNVNIEEIQKLFVEKGIWVRPFGKLIYIMPSFIISNEELAFLCKKVLEVVETLD